MKSKSLLVLLSAGAIAACGLLYAADHADSPTITGSPLDITDVYAYQSPANANNLVLVANTQGLLSPSASAAAQFDANTLLQFSIDNTGDNVEDLVIQAVYDASNKKMNFYGPIKPTTTGMQSQLEGSMTASVGVTAYGAASPTTATGSGMTVFAGPRDDPFFFDLAQFKKVIGGMATSFNNPGTDTFAGTNVLSVVVEVPKTALNAPASGNISVWLTTRKKV